MAEVNAPVTSEPMMSRYLGQLGNRRGLPISGTFELTARCNFSCPMCYVHLPDTQELLPKELTADQWLDIAAQARDQGMIFLLLTGGEPFIRQDFAYLYENLVKMGLLVSINTNGSLYNGALRELFNRYPPSRINVTLYGGSEETYRRFCRNASFGRVLENLRSMKEDGLQVRLNVSLTPGNACDMEEIARISRELNLQAKTSAYMYPPVRLDGQTGVNSARFTAEEAGAAMARWNALRDSREVFLKRAERWKQYEKADDGDACSDVENEQEGVMCRAGRSSFWMTWDGRLLPCGTMDVEATYPLRDGFRKAWDEVRANTAAIRLPKECSSCRCRSNCSVCASICKGETGRFDGKPEYLCALTESLRTNTIAIADRMRGEMDHEDQA